MLLLSKYVVFSLVMFNRLRHCKKNCPTSSFTSYLFGVFFNVFLFCFAFFSVLYLATLVYEERNRRMKHILSIRDFCRILGLFFIEGARVGVSIV